MFDYEFIKAISDQLRIYQEFPLPVIICDRQWRPYWGNELAKHYYAHLTEPEAIWQLLGAVDADRLLDQLARQGSCTVRELFGFSNVGATLTPILSGEDIVGVVFLFIRQDNLVEASDIYQPVNMAGALGNSIRDAVVEIFSVLDLAAQKSDLMETGWMKSGFNRIAFNNYRILRIAGNISDFSRYQSGLLDFSFQPVELTHALDELAGAVNSIGESMSVPIRFHLPEEELFVGLDSEKFETALFNLLHNALYYTRPGNRVQVSLTRSRGRAVLLVDDRGLGIPADELPRVTQPYYAYTHGGIARGLGLGLTNARIVTEAHDGTLTLGSREGRGTAVRVELPLLTRPDQVQFAQRPDRLRLGDRFAPIYTGLADAALSPFAGVGAGMGEDDR